jgi:membrane fusion protein, heavy metal efflux system
MPAFFPLLQAVALAIALSTTGVSAHEGHDHGDAAKAALAAVAKPRVEAISGPFELVGLLQGGELVVYLDRFETNEPVTRAALTVETPAGPVSATARDDLYRLPAAWAKPGSHDLIFAVSLGESVEVLAGTLVVPAIADTQSPAQVAAGWGSIGVTGLALTVSAAFAAGLALAWIRRASLAVFLSLGLMLMGPVSPLAHEGEHHGTKVAGPTLVGDKAQRLEDGALFVPKPVQRLLSIRTVTASKSEYHKSIDMPGRVIPDPSASGFVQASVSGRLSAPEGGFPKLGASVKAGDLLAFVTPPFQAIDVSDMRQKAGELEQQISIVERRIARYEMLIKTGAITKVALDEAELELKGLKERRSSLDKVRAEPERLVAPVSGVIAAANAVAGQIAETNAIIFQIVDPAHLWVEALTFSDLPDAKLATAITSEGRELTLSFQGAGLTDRSQAIPVHFAITSNAKGLRVGQLVTVLAPTGEPTTGLALPRASVLRTSNGQTIVFEHTGAERFEARLVRSEPLDAASLLVLGGLEPGARVVTQGAELLNQIR